MVQALVRFQCLLLKILAKAGIQIQINISLGTGNVNSMFWGCDLTEGYIKENAYYTT